MMNFQNTGRWRERGLQRALWLALTLLVWLFVPATQAGAATCVVATGQGTAPNDYKNYCWLDFSTYNDTLAQSAAGQSFTFNLPDGSTLSLTAKTVKQTGSANPAIVATAAPSWGGAAFGNSAFIGIPNKPILYTAQNGSQIQVTLSAITVVPPTGGVSNFAIVVADGESTNGNEALSFTTNGAPWVQLAQIANGGAYPTVSGVGTTTVTETGINGTVGAFVFGSTGNPSQVSTVLTAGGLQGMLFGIRYASISVVSQLSSGRINAADQFTYSLKTTGGATIAAASTSGTGTNGFAPAGVPTVAASYPIVVNQAMATGSVDTLGNYLTSLSCTNANAGSSTVLPSGYLGNSFTISSLQYGDALTCVFTDSAYPTITGTVYGDANHNASLDGVETGIGLSGLYVKLAAYSGGSCQATATVAAPVNSATGAYAIAGVAYGSYCLTLTNSSALANTTAYTPPGWVGTEAPLGVRQVTIVASPPLPQNFGLYNGSQLSAQVFADSGSPGGSANDGLQSGGELGLANVNVTATVSGSVVGSGVTNGSGAATLWIPASVSGSVVVTPTAPAGYLATGGLPGNTGGAYARPSVTFAYAAGTSYTGLLFGLVPANELTTDGAQTAKAGSTIYYPHSFIAGSAGQVSFSTSGTSAPAIAGWGEAIYRDLTCSGQISSADALIAAPIPAVAGQQICILVKEFVPAGAPLNAQDKVAVSAAFAYSGSAAPAGAVATRTDTTTVSALSDLQLIKAVRNLTQGGGLTASNSALPGDTVQYQLTLTNLGTASLTTLVVSDATPAFTTFVSAACPGSLPASLTSCNVPLQPAVGGQGIIQWVFVGSFAPGSQFTVTFNAAVFN